MHLCVMLYCGMTDWTPKFVNWDVFSETGDPKVQWHDSVRMMPCWKRSRWKSIAENLLIKEMSPSCGAWMWMSGEHDWCLHKIKTLAKNVKFFCCMFFNSSRQRIYDNFKYRAPNRTKILLYKYYIPVVFILILACKILYTYRNYNYAIYLLKL